MSDYIRTYTGIEFYPSAPRAEDFCIRDIAHALSLICRGNGHVRSFWSVGQHCIWAAREAKARGLGNRLALACLLHDAGECYMSDVPRPFKKTLPQYCECEDALLDILYTRYLGSVLTDNEQISLRQIDDDLLYYDLHDLLAEPTDKPAPALCIPPDYTVLPFHRVEALYLALFYEIGGRDE